MIRNINTVAEAATEMKGAMIPVAITQNGNRFSSETWLTFRYNADDTMPPHKWTKIIKYQKKYFMWMSYNSDSMTVNYKECPKGNIATAV